jgi:hypothetical protein
MVPAWMTYKGGCMKKARWNNGWLHEFQFFAARSPHTQENFPVTTKISLHQSSQRLHDDLKETEKDVKINLNSEQYA